MLFGSNGEVNLNNISAGNKFLVSVELPKSVRWQMLKAPPVNPRTYISRYHKIDLREAR